MSFLRPFAYAPFQVRAVPEVAELPFALQRTALVTRDPELIEAALEAFEEAEGERELYDPPQGPYPLPQKMGFQQWKTPPMTGFANRPDHADPYATARAFIQMRQEALEDERALRAAGNPIAHYPIEHAGFDRRGSHGMAPVDTSEVLLRDAPAYGRPIQPYPGPNAAEEFLGEDEEVGPYTQGIQRSLEQVRAVQARFVGLLLDDVRGGVRGRR